MNARRAVRARATWRHRAAWLWIAALACSSKVERSPDRDTIVKEDSSLPTVVRPDSARITVAGPTLVIFFRGAYTAADSGGDAAEALGDLQYHLGTARPALDSLGVAIVERYGDDVEYTLDDRVRRFVPNPDSSRAAYLFLHPGRPVQVHYGASTERRLTDEVRSRFRLAPRTASP